MNRINGKLRSEKGASITFALLIFLVCSVVSIAVVVAGTAAAGRMSQRAETDRRYYAVSSAVELLCKEFKGKTTTAEYEKPFVGDGVIITVKMNGAPMASDFVLESASRSLVKKLATGGENSATPDERFTLTVQDGSAYDFLNCTIEEYVKTDGRVVFKVYNTNDDKRYALEATLDANISTSTTQYKKTVEGVEKQMEKVTHTLVWSLNSIKKGVAPQPEPEPEDPEP